MPGGGASIGGDYGRQNEVTARDVEMTAWTDVNKALLAIVQDTLEVVVTQLGGNIWKYDTLASNPTLHPLRNLRMSKERDLPPDESWKPLYDGLVSQLPIDIQNVLAQLQQVPIRERNVTLVALDNLLSGIAKVLARVKFIGIPVDLDSVAGAHRLQNLKLPLLMLSIGRLSTNAMLEGALAFLKQVGPNHPNFDQINNVRQNLEWANNELKDIQNELVNGNTDILQGDRIMNLAEALAGVQNFINGNNMGVDLSLLNTVLNVMTLTVAALSLGSEGSPSLLIALYVATIGLSTNENTLGLVGPSLSKLTETVSSALLGISGNGDNPGAQQLFPALVTTALLVGIVLSQIGSEHGIGMYANDDPAVRQDGENFSFELALHFAAGMNVIKETFQHIARASGAGENIQEMIAEILAMIAMLMMILAAMLSGNQDSNALVNSLSSYLEDGITKIEDYLSQGIAEGTFDTEVAQEIGAFLQQAKMALQEGNAEGFWDACSSMLELMGISLESLGNDLAEIDTFAEEVSYAFTTGQNEQTNLTGISQA